ncbi:hypothetical protein LIER_34262 [Lithospermum erythrorhizon]|uniref:Uncharacterized protein n=1 Tax=Lithospermum erythrorhizon TaxID=34254 RepID=A0AAV3S184_LITER
MVRHCPTHAGVEYRCLLCNKNVVASIRPRVSMDVYDHSGRMTVEAIESVAEQILQCTPTKLARLVKERLLLMAYFDDTVPPEIMPADPIVSLSESSSKAAVGCAIGSNVARTSIIDTPTPKPSEKTADGELGVSSLKRQVDSVSILVGSPAKKTLFPETSVSSAELPNHDVEVLCLIM